MKGTSETKTPSGRVGLEQRDAEWRLWLRRCADHYRIHGILEVASQIEKIASEGLGPDYPQDACLHLISQEGPRAFIASENAFLRTEVCEACKVWKLRDGVEWRPSDTLIDHVLGLKPNKRSGEKHGGYQNPYKRR